MQWVVMRVLSALIMFPVAGAQLADLEFLTGRWIQANGDSVAEEYWMPPAGGTMVAAFRWSTGEKLVAVELVIVIEEADGVVLRFKHFDAGYQPWETGEANTYWLESVVGQRAVFRRTSESARVPLVMVYERNGQTLRFRGTHNADAAPSEEDLIIEFTRREY